MLGLRKGKIVAFMGTDGCGKSTIINEVQKKVPEKFNGTYYFHLAPKIIYKAKPNHDVTQPHSKELRSSFFSYVKLIIYLLEYWLGYLFIIRKLLREKKLVLFDRYYHDLLIDPRRYRFGGSLMIGKFIGKIIPKPNIWILLDAPVNILQKRKQEISIEKMEKQRIDYISFINKVDGHIINSNQNLEKVVSEVLKLIEK